MQAPRSLGVCSNVLGEGPVWCPVSRVLWWIDIADPHLWQFDPASGTAQSWPLPKPPGSFALRDGGGFFFAFRGGPALLDRPGGELAWLDMPGVALGDDRFNDGKCDRAGRFWAGTLDRRVSRPIGHLYRFDGLTRATPVIDGVTLGNGIGWSPDNRTMYFSDTGTKSIYAFDFDLAAGAIARKRVFVQVAPGHGGPDGLTVDADGYVWSCQFDRWCVHRYAPDGRLDRVLEVPVARPTSVMFGGADLATLYITTATMDLTAAQLAEQPGAGDLFAVEPGVRGLPEPRFAG